MLLFFFRGLGIAVFRAFPLHGTIFLVYETVMKVLEDGLFIEQIVAENNEL